MKIFRIFKLAIFDKFKRKMANQGISMPSGAGGLMRYNEEYKSSFMLKPSHIVLLIIAIIAFTVILKIFFPIGG